MRDKRRAALSRLEKFFAPDVAPESAMEGVGRRSTSGAPGPEDTARIAQQLRVSQRFSPEDPQWDQMESLATSLVAQAERSLNRVAGGQPEMLSSHEAVAIEAVVHTRGRPAVRVLGDALENIERFPNSDQWQTLYNEFTGRIMDTTRASAAVHVQDALLPRFNWVHGTAVRISETHALTNRHVVISSNGGVSLIRRRPGTQEGRLKGSYRVTLDFADDDGPTRNAKFAVTGVPFVTADNDPVDAAILSIAPMDGVPAETAPVLPVSNADLLDADDRLYVIGHPGRMQEIPEDVSLVFNAPDEKKRVSFGRLMDPDEEDAMHVVHDASTVGGFSGGGAHGFGSTDIIALHYLGDSQNGNRAIAARALRGHAGLSAFIP